jgi:hypothetical protein
LSYGYTGKRGGDPVHDGTSCKPQREDQIEDGSGKKKDERL